MSETFILVHGGLQGGWTWDFVAPTLREKNHRVFTPTLKGMGNRSHELSKHVGLEDHAQDICNLILKENLSNIILIGHSYGGMVITLVANKFPDKIKQLIYVDALVPDNNQCALDTIEKSFADMIRKAVDEFGEGWKIDPIIIDAKNITENHREFILSKLSATPFKTNTDVANFSEEQVKKIKSSYIFCTQGRGFTKPSAEKAKSRHWDYYEINSDHLPMFSKPDELAELILHIAGV